MALKFFLPISLAFFFSLFADIVERSLQSIGLSHINELYQILQSPEIATSIKMRTLRRIAVIYQENIPDSEKETGKIVENFRQVLKNHNEDEPPINHYLLRSEVCSVIHYFISSKNSENFLQIAQSQLVEDKNLEVKANCAQTLGYFKDHAQTSGKILNEVLGKQLKEENLDEKNIRLTMNLINAIGRVRYRAAFVSLIKVLQSGYPPMVKKEAEYAIRQIRAP